MRTIASTFVLLIGISASSSACPFCNRKIMAGIYNSQFYPNLFTMLSAFVVLALIVGILSAMSAKRHRTRLAANPNVKMLTPVPLTTASIVLGIGMIGFIDGIVLHQYFSSMKCCQI